MMPHDNKSVGWEHLHLSDIDPEGLPDAVLVEVGRLVQRGVELRDPHFNASQDGFMKCEREWRGTLGFSDLGETNYYVAECRRYFMALHGNQWPPDTSGERDT
jgi:hypothetical protein